MNCEQAETLLAAYVFGEVQPPMLDEVRAHLEACATCAAKAEEMKGASGLLQQALTAVEQPALSAERQAQLAGLNWPRREAKPRINWRRWLVSARAYPLATAAVALFVIGVIGVLAGISLPALGRAKEFARSPRSYTKGGAEPGSGTHSQTDDSLRGDNDEIARQLGDSNAPAKTHAPGTTPAAPKFSTDFEAGDTTIQTGAGPPRGRAKEGPEGTIRRRDTRGSDSIVNSGALIAQQGFGTEPQTQSKSGEGLNADGRSGREGTSYWDRLALNTRNDTGGGRRGGENEGGRKLGDFFAEETSATGRETRSMEIPPRRDVDPGKTAKGTTGTVDNGRLDPDVGRTRLDDLSGKQAEATETGPQAVGQSRPVEEARDELRRFERDDTRGSGVKGPEGEREQKSGDFAQQEIYRLALARVDEGRKRPTGPAAGHDVDGEGKLGTGLSPDASPTPTPGEPAEQPEVKAIATYYDGRKHRDTAAEATREVELGSKTDRGDGAAGKTTHADDGTAIIMKWADEVQKEKEDKLMKLQATIRAVTEPAGHEKDAHERYGDIKDAYKNFLDERLKEGKEKVSPDRPATEPAARPTDGPEDIVKRALVEDIVKRLGVVDEDKEKGDKGQTVRDAEKLPPVLKPPDESAPKPVTPIKPEDIQREPVDKKSGEQILVVVNPFVMAKDDYFSTFALEADNGSYTMARAAVRRNVLPPANAVRVEEFVNNFDYNYSASRRNAFGIHSTLARSPFRPEICMLQVGVKAKVAGGDGRRPNNFVLCIDNSGSMAAPDRLALAKQSAKMLVNNLAAVDRVAVVAFNTNGNIALDTTVLDKGRKAVLECIESLQPSGSTNLANGLAVAYAQAHRSFESGANNTVVLLTDGVANVGTAVAQDILTGVQNDRKQGITLTCAGVGGGEYNDALLEQLANNGDGQYFFIDTEDEAKRVFVDEFARLQIVAKDAKIQVEFDPDVVRRYRLLGYESRDIADKDFRNDAVDAGEIGSGQSGTALYEVELTKARGPVATVRVRYRDVDSGRVEEIASRVNAEDVIRVGSRTPPRFRLAACAAQFAELLRGSMYAKQGTLKEIEAVMSEVCVELPLDNKAAELLQLVREAQGLTR